MAPTFPPISLVNSHYHLRWTWRLGDTRISCTRTVNRGFSREVRVGEEGRREVGSGKWEVGSGKWEVGSGKEEDGGRRRTGEGEKEGKESGLG